MTVPTTEIEVIERLKGLTKMHQSFISSMNGIEDNRTSNPSERRIAAELKRFSIETVNALNEVSAGVATIAVHHSIEVDKIMEALSK